jgi:hypothetical protein
MKLNRGLVVGSCAVIFALSGASLVACGSDDNTGFPTSSTKDASTINSSGDDTDATTGDDGTDSAPPNGDDNDATTSGDDDTTPDTGTTTDSGDAGTGLDDAGDAGDAADASDGSTCKALPPIPDAGVNTCYKANNDAGCSGSTSVCCDIDVKGKFTDVCAATVSACAVLAADAGADAGDAGATIVAYQCGSPSDCVVEDAGAGAKCYLQPTAPFDGGTLAPSACGIISGSSGTICTTGTPITGSLQICSTSSNCPAGKTCTAVEASGKFFGACL